MKKNTHFVLLLLGPGESGKSTVLKQMKIITEPGLDGGGFTDKDRENYKPIVRSLLLQNAQILVDGATALGIALDAKTKEYSKFLNTYQEAHYNELITYIKHIWNDKGIQDSFSKYRELSLHGYNLPDSAKYFFDQVERLLDPKIFLTNEDILRCRAKTSALVQHEFMYKNSHVRMLDVGGQRSERKKWLYVMCDVLDAVIFCASINEYDLNLREDISKNRFEETLESFKFICNHKYLKKVNIILF